MTESFKNFTVVVNNHTDGGLYGFGYIHIHYGCGDPRGDIVWAHRATNGYRLEFTWHGSSDAFIDILVCEYNGQKNEDGNVFVDIIGENVLNKILNLIILWSRFMEEFEERTSSKEA